MASHKDAQQNKEVEPLICACQGFGAFLQQCPPRICVLLGTPGGSGPGSLCTLPVSMTHLCWEASVCAAGARCHTSALCEHTRTWLSSWEALCGCWPLSYSWRVGNRETRSIGEALLCWLSVWDWVRRVVQGPGSATPSLLHTSGWHQLWGRLWNVLGL